MTDGISLTVAADGYLGRKLSRRPSIKTLEERGILQDQTLAPALQAAALSLEQSMKSDSLNKSLTARSPVNELVETNILTGTK